MSRTRILVVDDDPGVLKFVSACLRKGDYEPIMASNGQEALRSIEEENPALVILDIRMPKIDGIEVCRRLREWSPIPVIMLSALDSEEDKAKCLDLGADDYITKPFGIAELAARVKAVLRRTKGVANNQSVLAEGKLKVSFAQRQVTMAGKEIKLTPTEYSLMQEFAVNAGKVLTYTHLLNKVWGPEYKNEREYLHVFVRRLRAKIEPEPTNPRYIINVSGIGYKLNLSEAV
ncbi:MAG: response regulator transcription factor [Chloroflexota bacterium]